MNLVDTFTAEIESEQRKKDAFYAKKEAEYANYLEKTNGLLKQLEPLSKLGIHFTLNAKPEGKQAYIHDREYFLCDVVNLHLAGFIGHVSWVTNKEHPEECIRTKFFFREDAFFGSFWTMEDFVKRLAKCYR